MLRARVIGSCLVLAVVLIATACDAILASTPHFRDFRYYATGDITAGSADYSALFCPDGRVDMQMADFEVHAVYHVHRDSLIVRTKYNEIRYHISRDGRTLTPQNGELALVRNPAREGEDLACAEAPER